MTIRVLATAIPFVVAWFTVAGFSDLFFRPSGTIGLAIWLVQAFLAGVAVSMATEHFTRRLLPLASLFSMTLVFPDQAPSRFGVALRSSTVKRLQTRYSDVEGSGLGHDASSAAATAIELIGLLSRHDRLTRGHTERVRAHAVLIAEEMGISADERELLTWGAMLHDIGKLTVSPEILNKAGKPTDAEWAELKGHPAASAEILAPLQGWLGDWVLAASEHHERWDGDGYPAGLAGTEISIAGRITAVADAYDVITSKRSYKKPMSAEAARQELIRCAGSQFDPDVVRAFLNISLRRRWVSGPLASLTELPRILSLGTNLQSTAVIVAGTAATVGSVALIPPPIPEDLASTTPTTDEVVEDTVTVNEEPLDPGDRGSTVVDQPTPTVSELPVETVPSSTGITAVDDGSSSSTQLDKPEQTLRLGPPLGETGSSVTAPAVPTTLWPGLWPMTTANPTITLPTAPATMPLLVTASTTTTKTTAMTALPTITTAAGDPLANVADGLDVTGFMLTDDEEGSSPLDR